MAQPGKPVEATASGTAKGKRAVGSTYSPAT